VVDTVAETAPAGKYFMGWNEETVYLRRSDYPTPEAASEEFRRLSIDDFGMTSDDIEGIEAVADSVRFHESDDDRCFHGTCECPKIDVWEFAP
jgi:hypothetical protein